MPDDLARQIPYAGLLRDWTIAARLREAMQKRQVDRLFDTMGELARLDPALTGC